ncbi:MAG TPA: HU family DNA-binding protein [Phycisphaerae bacterium]|nr:HU family DNA-binding protein [Phycisphaerae bacterium]
MNRDQMIEGIMRNAGLSKANVSRFYDGLAELARKELLRTKEFVMPGLGALRVRTRKARTGRNPQTGETIRIPQKKVVRFRMYRSLSELLNGPGKGASPSPQTPPAAEGPNLWPQGEPPPEQ